MQVEVLALDANGSRIAQEVRTVRYLFPRETTGLVQDFELLSGLQTYTVEVRVKEGLENRQLRYSQPLLVKNASWVEAEDGIRLTGWINNSDPYTYQSRVERDCLQRRWRDHWRRTRHNRLRARRRSHRHIRPGRD